MNTAGSRMQARWFRTHQLADLKRSKRNPVFPGVPRGFWRRFQHRWGDPLQILEKVIAISESFGTNPGSPLFETMDEAYWGTLRSLHSRTCLHARAVLALLHNGLVDPATAQWRICHETATIARFIALNPEMAPRYMKYAFVNKHRLAKDLFDRRHPEAPTAGELSQLKGLADQIEDELSQAYGRLPRSNDYAWSGLQSFRDIETEVYQREGVFQLRGEYIRASERVHAAPNAGEPVEMGDGTEFFPVDFGLTDPADLTSISAMGATRALLRNAALTDKDEERLTDLTVEARMVGVLCWLSDPGIICQECGGYSQGSPPEEIPPEYRPEPCSCP